ncbi:MAG TPA: hypothetical protein VMB47_11715 [Candidatus Aquilonibacter sp.]|nr:hypothetical protein [Candidatus Aquilonibacter sp.]
MPDSPNPPASFSFSAHVGLLDQFLVRRVEIVERIEDNLLNVRGKETERIRSRLHFHRLLNDCFFALPGLASQLARLKGQAAAMHLADGFEPIQLDRFSIEFDPLDLIIRAYEHWGASRWPGRSSRLAWAQIIYSTFLIRQLENLTLRIWDEGTDLAGDRLDQLQALLDRLNDPGSRAGGGAVLVRDVRWLVQTAQGALTKHIEPYFRVAERVSASFTDSVRLGLHAAGAKLAGGHLRSQVRYRSLETSRPIDDAENLAIARNSNSMDTALLLRDLVALLKSYDHVSAAADQTLDSDARIDLADAILQGISSDTELFLTRLDLLAPATMIEHLFIEDRANGHPQLTPLGRAHLNYLAEYRASIGRLAGHLKDDALLLAPAPEAYSPYGISYGFAADLLSNLALDKLISPSSSWGALSFEDVFASRGNLEAKLTRAKALAALPKRPGEQDHFYHSSGFAAEIFDRLVAALEARSLRSSDANSSSHRDGRIYVSAECESIARSSAALAAGAVSADEYCFTSHRGGSLSEGKTFLPISQILLDRNEGRYLASAQCDGEWFAVSKFILTIFLCRGTDALLSAVPPKVIEVLLLTCPGLIVPLTTERAT